MGGLVLVAVALAGCGTVGACAGCQDASHVSIALTGRVPHDLPVRVCVQGFPCQTVDGPTNGSDVVDVHLAEVTDASALDGRTVSVTADGQGFDAASFGGTGTLGFVPPTGECGCAHLRGTAEVEQYH